MLDINKAAKEIRQIGRDNGWSPPRRVDWVTRPDKILTLIALIHTEICEAHAEHLVRDMSHHDFLAAEFADIAIRTLDLGGGLTEDFAHFVMGASAYVPEDKERAFSLLHGLAAAASEKVRTGDLVKFLECLGELFFMTSCTAFGAFNIDLGPAIVAKMDVNRHRSFRHGGKRI